MICSNIWTSFHFFLHWVSLEINDFFLSYIYFPFCFIIVLLGNKIINDMHMSKYVGIIDKLIFTMIVILRSDNLVFREWQMKYILFSWPFKIHCGWNVKKHSTLNELSKFAHCLNVHIPLEIERYNSFMLSLALISHNPIWPLIFFIC